MVMHTLCSLVCDSFALISGAAMAQNIAVESYCRLAVFSYRYANCIFTGKVMRRTCSVIRSIEFLNLIANVCCNSILFLSQYPVSIVLERQRFEGQKASSSPLRKWGFE